MSRSDTSCRIQTDDDGQTTDDATSTNERRSVLALSKLFGGQEIRSTYTETITTKRSSDRFSDRVLSSSKSAKDKLYDSLIPSGIKDGSTTESKTTTVYTTENVVKSNTDAADAEDKLFNSLVSTSTKSDYSPTDSRNSYITTTTTRTSSSAEDDLYGTLLPRSITSVSDLPSPLSSSSSSISKRETITVESSRGGDSPTLTSPTMSTRRTSSYSSYADSPTTRTTSYSISSNPSEDYDRKDYSYRTDSYEYSSLNSPNIYTSKTYRSNSRSDDMLADQTYSTSVKSVYAAPERTVHERDLCTYCRKPFTGDAKMVLEDMKINCHASCFKCEVCNSTLGHMKAGDSMWIYKRMVHCENCFEVTRDKWRR